MEKPNSTFLEDNLKNFSQNLEVIADKESSDPENNHTELVKFSKRYFREGRRKIADQIKELRFQYFKKEKGNPERQVTITEQEKSIETLEKEKEQIESEIKELEDMPITVIGVYPGGFQTDLFNEAKPENFDEFMSVESVAEKIVHNLELEHPETQLIIKRPGQKQSHESSIN